MHRATVTMEGHIIDSLALPKVWDTIMDLGGDFEVEEFRVGKHKDAASFLKMTVEADTEERLADILTAIQAYGASAAEMAEAELEAVTMDGVFPADFYSTSNQPT